MTRLISSPWIARLPGAWRLWAGGSIPLFAGGRMESANNRSWSVKTTGPDGMMAATRGAFPGLLKSFAISR
jgi:hypothetical protein